MTIYDLLLYIFAFLGILFTLAIIAVWLLHAFSSQPQDYEIDMGDEPWKQ